MVDVGGIKVENQVVEIVNQVFLFFICDEYFLGILGFGFQFINMVCLNKQKMFIDNVLKLLVMFFFIVNICKVVGMFWFFFLLDCFVNYEIEGNYNFGFIDEIEYFGNFIMIFVDVVSGYWKFKGMVFFIGFNGINSVILDIVVFFEYFVIVDMGIIFFMIFEVIVQVYYCQVVNVYDFKIYGGWVFFCNFILLDFILYISSYKVVIFGELINFVLVDLDDFVIVIICYGGVQSLRGFFFVIYGNVFFKVYWIMFYVEEKKLGFVFRSGEQIWRMERRVVFGCM